MQIVLLRQMKYFAAVVERNSFTEAAEQCYISQSAISQQIQALEKELGVQLLIRENRRFSLTPAGEYFYRQCRQILSEVDAVCRETARIGQADDARLRIGYLKNYSGQELHRAVAEFSGLYPELTIDIVAGTHEELYDLLRRGGVDLAISDQRRAFSEEYENVVLRASDCYAEISANDPLAKRERLTTEELRRKPCILITPAEQRETEERYYRDTLGFSGSFLFAENLEEGRLMVLGNRGFLPIEHAGTLPPPAAAIRRIPIFQGDRPLRRNICAFWLKKNANYYIEEFSATLHRLIEQNA